MIGLQALLVALGHGAVVPPVRLFRLAGLPPLLESLYDAASDFAAIERLPREAAQRGVNFPPASTFERCVDLRDFAFDADFAATPMIDFFLRRLRLDPALVPATSRRNAWLASRMRPVPPPLAAGYALVCPCASMALRDMPGAIHAAILRRLGASGWRVATQGAVSEEAQCSVPRATTLGELCGWVQQAALVVSTDTGMVHLADAFGVPCLAFFTTHRPEWRVRDYPRCLGLHLPAPGLPEALEFARGDADVVAAQAAWFPDGDDLAWLETALAAGLALVTPAWPGMCAG